MPTIVPTLFGKNPRLTFGRKRKKKMMTMIKMLGYTVTPAERDIIVTILREDEDESPLRYSPGQTRRIRLYNEAPQTRAQIT